MTLLSEAQSGAKLGVQLMLALAALVGPIFVFLYPVPTSLAILAAVVLLFGIRFPGWTLLVYAASLFLFQVPLLHDIPIAVPTGIAVFFLGATALNLLVTRSSFDLRSPLPRLVVLLASLILVSALINFEWLVSNPRGLVTYCALCSSVIAVGLVMRDGKWFWRLVRVLTFGAMVVSTLAIYASWTGHYNPFSFFGAEAGEAGGRAYALADPNYTAAILVTLLPFLVAIFQCRQSLVSKALAFLQITLACVAIGMTASRGGIVGTLVTTLACFVLMPSGWGSQVRTKAALKCRRGFSTGRFAVLGPLVLGLALAAALAPRVLWERLSTLQDWKETGKQSRVELWTDYLEKWSQSPWWGVGPGHILGPGYADDERWEVEHNTPLQVLVECGVFGLAAFLLVNGVAFWGTLSARNRFAERGERELSILSGAVGACLIGFHSTAFFLNSATHKELWLLLGLTAALGHISRVQSTVTPAAPQRLPYPLRQVMQEHQA